MAKRAAKAIETKATEHTNLEGLAWLEAAESYARFTNDAALALALLYLRGALTGDGGLTVALNLAEGTGHLSPAKVAALCNTAIGSFNEVELQLRLARARDIIWAHY